MLHIDMQTWPRRKHFELFNAFDFPHFNLCADIDITPIHKGLPRSPFSFTSFTHPIHMNPVDSIPRIAWGKFFSKGDRIKMPLSVQIHHALADGIHVGRYFNLVQEYLDARYWILET